jgi:hypothetical protein
MVRDDWKIYSVGEQFPKEINHIIARFLLRLNNPESFNISQDHLYQKLLGSCITLYKKEKEWHLPIYLFASDDGQYYLNDSPRDFVLSIYDKKDNKIKESVDRLFSQFLSKKNILILECRALYHIETRKKHRLHPPFSYDAIISPCQNYIAAPGQEGYWYAYDITNFDDIKSCVFPCLVDYVQFSEDGKYIIGSKKNSNILRLFAIENGKIKIIHEKELGTIHIKSIQNRKYKDLDYFTLIAGDTCLGIKVKEDMTFEQIYNVSGVGCVIVEDNFLLLRRTNDLFLCKYDGSDCVKFDSMQGTCREKNGYFFYNSQRADLVARHAYIIDNQVCFHEYTTKNAHYCTLMEFNKQGAFFTIPVEEKIACFTLQGQKLFSLNPEGDKIYWHPNGRALLFTKDKKNYKRALYPKGADEHLKKLAHKPLTLSQYVALEKICTEVEQLRKKENMAK